MHPSILITYTKCCVTCMRKKGVWNNVIWFSVWSAHKYSVVVEMPLLCKLRMYLWWSVCALYLLACQLRATVGDSELCCCVCVMSFKHWLTPLFVDSAQVGTWGHSGNKLQYSCEILLAGGIHLRCWSQCMPVPDGRGCGENCGTGEPLLSPCLRCFRTVHSWKDSHNSTSDTGQAHACSHPTTCPLTDLIAFEFHRSCIKIPVLIPNTVMIFVFISYQISWVCYLGSDSFFNKHPATNQQQTWNTISVVAV